MAGSSKKMTAYLPPDMLSAIKLEAAQKGNMRYSDLVSSKISDALSSLSDIKSYSELLENREYSNLLSSFTPSKIGRPWHKETISKVPVTLFLSTYYTSKISSFSKRFGLSRSSFIELSIRVSNKDINNGNPLIIKLSDSDKLLLKDLVVKTGASGVSEFLHSCNFTWVISEIRKEVANLHS